MISQIFDTNTFKILSLFSISPGSKFRRKEIKERTKLNNVPLDTTLLKTINSGIIKKEENLYHINFENEHAKQIIQIISQQYKKMKELPFDVYCILIDISSHLSGKGGIEAYLFGSYSKLVYREDSDVDIAILGLADKKQIQKTAQMLGKTYKKGIELHFFEKEKFYKNRKDPLVRDILRNGIRIL